MATRLFCKCFKTAFLMILVLTLPGLLIYVFPPSHVGANAHVEMLQSTAMSSVPYCECPCYCSTDTDTVILSFCLIAFHSASPSLFYSASASNVYILLFELLS